MLLVSIRENNYDTYLNINQRDEIHLFQVLEVVYFIYIHFFWYSFVIEKRCEILSLLPNNLTNSIGITHFQHLVVRHSAIKDTQQNCWHILQIKITFYVTLKLVATKILISQQSTMATNDGFDTHGKNMWWLQHCCYYGSMSKAMVVPSGSFNVHLMLLLHVQIHNPNLQSHTTILLL